jgi:hypothetical protein
MPRAKKLGQREHRDRKNPGSRQQYAERRREQNAKRRKQEYNPITERWER